MFAACFRFSSFSLVSYLIVSIDTDMYLEKDLELEILI